LKAIGGLLLGAVLLLGGYAVVDASNRGESFATAILAMAVAFAAFLTLLTAPDLTEVHQRLGRIGDDVAAIRTSAQSIATAGSVEVAPESSKNSRGLAVGFITGISIALAIGCCANRRERQSRA
jgi:hypothetical protein